jgi:formylglycine-generating enzyme required for sulfatase activity
VLDISDHDFRRRAAMKVILARFAESPEAMERFLAEAQVTAQLEHPNIVPIHDLGVMDDGTLYFTMKMIEGQSLGKVVKLLQQDRGLLKKEGQVVPPDAESKAAAETWSETEKLHVFLKVLDGVGFANSRGVIHRDLKPDNIMLGGHGEVLVVDWGIAKVLGNAEKKAKPEQGAVVGKDVVSIRGEDAISATMAGSAMGTIYYMPPEQAQGELEHIDARSDVYALGATLYELLALKRCLSGASIPEMIVKITNGEIIPLDQADPTIDPDLAAIVHKAMARDRARRYADCAAFADDLRRYLAGQAVEARKRSIGELIRQWIAQNKLKLQVGAAAVVLVGAAIGGTFWSLEQKKRSDALALLAQAKSQFAALPKDADADAINPIAGMLALAMDKQPGDAGIRAFNGEVASALGAAKMKAQEVADRKAAIDNAAKLVAAGRAAEAKGDAAALADAERAYTSALDLTPTDTALRQALIAVQKKLGDSRRIATELELKKHLAASRAALADAAKLPALDAKVGELMKTAQAELVLADADHEVKIEGVADQAKALEVKRAELASAAKADDDLKHGRELATQAKALMDAKNPDKAMEMAQQAIGFAPKDAEVGATYAAATVAKNAIEAERAEQARRANAEAAAAKQLGEARSAKAEMEKQRDLMIKSRREAERLGRELADKPLSDKKAQFAALQAEREARRALVQAWASCEGQSQNVVATLEPWVKGDKPDDAPKPYREALAILAELYHNRLLEAKATSNLPEIEAFRNLLARADRLDRAYAAELADQATVTITGQPAGAVIMARPVQESADTRLLPVGEPKPIDLGKPVSLQSGAWMFTAGDTTITWVLRPDRPTTIAWPKELKQVPGVPLRYVPGDLHVNADGEPAGMKPFLLGATEVTVEQYLAFLKDPEIYAQVRKGYKAALAAAADTSIAPDQLPKVPYVPFIQGAPYEYELRQSKDGTDLADIAPLPNALELPVAAVSRDDAEKYCEWLSKKFGVKARLPSRAEWQFAANGDDIHRAYPWGPHFDGNFATCSGVQQAHGPVPARQQTGDVGPFGHIGLAGNVREWLGERGSKDDVRSAGIYHSLIAGGSWSDDDEHWFRCSYVESLPPDQHQPSIGFRILVEVQ